MENYLRDHRDRATIYTHTTHHQPNILVIVGEETTQNVDGKDSEATLRLNLHDGQHRLVQYGMANILTGLCICSYL